MIAGLRAAVGMFTALPVGAVTLDRATTRTAMIMAPLAVLPVAVIATALGWLLYVMAAPSMVVGLVIVAVLALGTRAFHLDGLADTVDGLGSGWNRERALSIMRRGDIGPMGVVALIIVIGLQACAYGTLAVQLNGAVAVVVIICLPRTAVLIGCSKPVAAARPEGLGAMVAGTIPVPVTVAVGLVATAVLILVGGWLPMSSWLSAGLAGLLGYGAVLLLVRHAVRRFGGVTGDVLGAAVEVFATVIAVGLILH